MQMNFRYPYNPGYKGQLTSKEAAKDNNSSKNIYQHQVVQA